MDALDIKLNEVYPGKVVRKDLVHRIKKAANVPSVCVGVFIGEILCI